MNRYPLWKYVILVVAIVIGALYALPNAFGESPAVQVSSAKASVPLDLSTVTRVQEALQAVGLTAQTLGLEGNSIKARFVNTDDQLKAKDAIQKALNPNAAEPGCVVALNLLTRSPAWLTALHASPMYLGLDLRGGVHFMLQVDMQAALSKKAESLAGDMRSALRDKNVRHGGVSRNGQTIEVVFRDAAMVTAAKAVVQEQFPDLSTVETTRCCRARDSAARPRPHRGAAARCTRHGQGQRHFGSHGHPRNSHG